GWVRCTAAWRAACGRPPRTARSPTGLVSGAVTSRSREQPELALEPDHLEAGLRRLAALVALLDAGALHGLLAVVDREHAEADGEGVGVDQLLDAARAFLADVVEMRGFAAYDAAERDVAVEAAAHGIELARVDGVADRRGYFECARHRHLVIGYARGIEHGGRSFQQLVGNVLVVARLDDQYVRYDFAFRLICHSIPTFRNR